MRMTPRMLAVLGVTLLGALTPVCTRHPAGPDEPAPAVMSELGSAGERLPDLVALRLAAKNLIAREVVDGRRSLVETAALFGALNRLPPESPRPALQDVGPPVRPARARTGQERCVYPPAWPFPVRTGDEWLCRQVVYWVDRLLNEEAPGRTDEVLARLEAEYGEELHRHGAVRLPDSESVETVEGLLNRTRVAMTDQQRKSLLSTP